MGPAQLAILNKAREGDSGSLVILGKALLKTSVFGPQNLPLAYKLFAAAAATGNIQGFVQMGIASLPHSPRSALRFFKAAADGQDASGAYNAGLLLAKGHNPSEDGAVAQEERIEGPDLIAALEYFDLASRLSAQAQSQQVLANSLQAHAVLSDTLAASAQSPGLDANALRRVFMASFKRGGDTLLEAELGPAGEGTIGITLDEGVSSLASFAAVFSATDGALPESATTLMRNVLGTFGPLVDTAGLSNLQEFVLLDAIQDMLGPLLGRSPEDRTLLQQAARYTERLAMSHYCRGSFARTESESGCFNGAVSAAISYHRRLARVDGGSLDAAAGADRVFELARSHAKSTGGATMYQRQAQTPRVYHPGLTGRAWWDASQFGLLRALEAAYSKGALRDDLLGVQQLQEGGIRGKAKASSAAAAGLQRIFTPYIAVSSVDDAGVGGWAEFGPLYDGVTWNNERCTVLPLLCALLREHASEICGSGSADAAQVEAVCGSDTLITILRLRPGTSIHAHCGTTNRRLIMHFAILGSAGVRFRVGDGDDGDGDGGWRGYGGDGRSIVFDDSFEHEVTHQGLHERFVVLVVLRHPEVNVL